AGLVWMKFVFGRISLVNKNLYYGLVGLASIPVLVSIYNAVKRKDERLNLIWLWLVLPLVLGFFVSFWFPAFIYFRFLYVLPAFYLIIAWGVTRIKSKGYRNFLIATLLVVNFVSWSIYIIDERQQREQWRQAVEFIESNAGSKDIAIFEYPRPFSPYRWYSSLSVEAVGVTDSISATPEKTADITGKAISGKDGVYYFEYLRDLSDPGRVVEEVLVNSGFEVAEIHDFKGVGHVYYWVRQ
ncbi:hypothetical protein IID22_04450, partial [Patescibacteria group bacterium]|nr:hypothetical protein [Patescibacteria group bacterium]